VVALKSDGTVWTWGDNSEGQLGIGSLADSSTPVQVCAVGESVGCETFLENVVAVRAGYLFSTALLEDGTLVSWGRNSDGELGTGDQTQRQIPDRVCAVGASWPCTEDNGNLLSGVIAFASGGGGHTIAILSNRSLAAWGFTKNGQVGTGHSADGGNDRVLIPEIVCGVGEMSSCTGKLSNIVAVDAWSALSVALDENGNLYAWGHNNYGQLGWNVADTEDLSGPDCQDTYCRNVPIQVCATGDAPCGEHFTGVESMAAGRRFSLALKTDHSVWAWGTNAEHELGAEMSSFCNVDYDAETPCTPIPVEVCTTGDDPCTKPLTGIAAIAAGTFNGYALSEDGTLWTWGDNTYGQLGIGSTATKTKPVRVTDY
jgi:alpha-tubulin suppressor-like RCC1 family protein